MNDALTFLVVDDNDLDVERVERAIRRLALDTPLVRAIDGLDALNCLRGTGERLLTRPPRVVLLDVNMPRMTGIEFLEHVRDDPELEDLPVVVVSTSSRPSDMDIARNHGALAYYVKPLLDEQLLEVIDLVD